MAISKANILQGTPESWHNFLWERTDFFEDRYRKGVAALAAVRQFVQENRPLNDSTESEFLCLYDQLLEMSGDVFSRVWQDPLAYAWSVTLYDRFGVLDMLRLRVSQTNDNNQARLASMVEQQLPEQLQFFKAFALAVAYLDDRSMDFEQPVRVRLPFAIPGTDLVLMGDHTADIHGISGSTLSVSKDGKRLSIDLDSEPSRQLTPIMLNRVPTIKKQGTQIKLNPFGARFPYYEVLDGEYSAAAPQPIGPDEVNALEEAIDLYAEFYPEGFDQFCRWLHVLSTKSPWGRGVGSATNTELPGLIFLMLPAAPVWLAETLIHEYFHQRLFFLDEEQPVLEEIPGPAINYQPWRWDARPPHGLLHATYVFTPVTRFYLRLYKSGRYSGPEAAYIADFTKRTSVRLQMGLDMLMRAGGFTPAGEEFFQVLKENIDGLVQEINETPLTLDLPAMEFNKQKNAYLPQLSLEDNEPMTIREALIEHIVKSEAGDKARHWISKLS